MEFSRTVWIGRVVGAVGFGLVTGSSLFYPAGRGLFAMFLAVEVAALLTATRLVRGTRRGDGEVLLQNGERLPHAELWLHHRVLAVEAVLAMGIGVASPILAFSTAGVSPDLALAMGLFNLVMMIALGAFAWNQWASGRLMDGLVRMARGDLRRSSMLFEWWARFGPVRQRHAFERCAARAELSAGQVDSAERRLQSAWNGSLSQSAALLAVLRLRRDDPDLARRWLKVSHPEGVVSGHARALVTAHLALWQGEAEDALDAVDGLSDLPPSHQRPIDLLRIAALQGMGREGEARRHLEALPRGLDIDAQSHLAFPAMWRWLAAVDGRVLPNAPSASGLPDRGTPAHADPFAAPRAAGAVASVPRLQYGAVPAEWLSVEAGRGRSQRGRWLRRAVLLGLSGALMALGLLLVGLTQGRTDSSERMVGLVAAAAGASLLFAWSLQLLSARSREGDRSVVLGNGQAIALSRWWIWRGLQAVPSILVVCLMGSATVAGGWLVGWETGLLAMLVGALLLWGASDPHQSAGVVYRCHTAPPQATAAWVARRMRWTYPSRHTAHAWHGLALLWAGRAEEAEAAMGKAAASEPEAARLLSWFHAGRAEVDLDHLLHDEPGPHLGPRYRHSVALALAALSTKREDLVADRVDEWSALAARLPNRFGDLLGHLTAVVDGRLRGVPPSDPPTHLEWLGGVWPCSSIDV